MVQEEIVCLLENLKATLPEGLVVAAMKQANCGAYQEKAEPTYWLMFRTMRVDNTKCVVSPPML
jgi:hypothetical protein